MHLFLGASIHFQRVKQTIHQPVNIPWPAWRKSLLEFCSRSTLVFSGRCCSRRVISMTIVLGFSGGSVAPILWGHFQAIKSFICVDLKESCEVPSGWNPLQRVTTVSMGFTLRSGHQCCPHVLMKQHQRRRRKSSENPLKGALQAVAGGVEAKLGEEVKGGETCQERGVTICSWRG